jgi:hypothetical protein
MTEDLRKSFLLDNGRYECVGAKEGFIGEGAWSIVLLGYENKNKDFKVAIKVGKRNSKDREFTEQEYNLMSELNHINVLRAFAHSKTNGQVSSFTSKKITIQFNLLTLHRIIRLFHILVSY